jgi:endonuclease/exonuclease/phosphatase family metal-dependent hydrolase
MRLRARVVVAAVSLALTTTAMPAAHAAPAEAFAPRRVSVISFNACGGVCRHGEVEVTARHIADLGEHADVILLQELCASQYDRIRDLLPAFHSRYAAATRSRACGTAFGVAVFVRAPVVESSVLPLPTRPGYERRNLLAVTATVGGQRTLIATVHLSPSPAAGLNDQLEAVARYLEAQPGGPMIVGGDFNSLPEKPELRRFYDASVGGTGRFREADEFRTHRAEIGGAPTFDTAARKIDYVFFSTSDFAAPTADSRPTALSDHHVYVATARPAAG